MLTVDLRTSLLVWHATSQARVAAIQRDGLRRMSKGIYFGLHPGVALGFAREHVPDGVVLTLAIPRQSFSWGQDLHVEEHEGWLWGDLPYSAILDARPVTTCPQVPSTWLAVFRSDSSDVHTGFAPWVEDVALSAHLRDCLAGAGNDPQTAMLAALYVSGLDRDSRQRLEPLTPALETAIASSSTLPVQAVACTLGLLRRRGWNPGVTVLKEWSLTVLSLWAYRMLDHAGNLPPTLAMAVQDACGVRRAAQLDKVLTLAAPGAPARTVPDVTETEALVSLCLYARRDGDAARACLEAIARSEDAVADRALLAVLTELRRVPVKARGEVNRHLQSRAPRLHPALERLARSAPALVARAAEQLLRS